MEHTKGELKENQVCCNCIDLLSEEDDSVVAQIIECDEDELSDTQRANAQELVRRWNAFEKDGLVDELVEACKECRATFIGLQEGSIGWQAMKKVNAAIAKVKA